MFKYSLLHRESKHNTSVICVCVCLCVRFVCSVCEFSPFYFSCSVCDYKQTHGFHFVDINFHLGLAGKIQFDAHQHHIGSDCCVTRTFSVVLVDFFSSFFGVFFGTQRNRERETKQAVGIIN